MSWSGPIDDLFFYTGFFVLKDFDIVEFCLNIKLSILKDQIYIPKIHRKVVGV